MWLSGYRIWREPMSSSWHAVRKVGLNPFTAQYHANWMVLRTTLRIGTALGGPLGEACEGTVGSQNEVRGTRYEVEDKDP